jgi:hypothetical protein
MGASSAAAAAAAMGLGKKNNNQGGSALGQLSTQVLENKQNTVGVSGSDPFKGSNPMSPTPNISMSDSYNSAASRPVFPPATQEKAAAVFGTNDQRQASTNGFKQEIKEKIISDIGSL